MRMWERWQAEGKLEQPLDLPHYKAVGEWGEALSRHADEAYNELSPAQQQLAEQIFKCLTEKGKDNPERRRPQTVHQLHTVTGAPEHSLTSRTKA
jgi:hypothetical protein